MPRKDIDRPARAFAITLVLAAAVAGCGDSRTPVPSSVAPAKPSSFHTLGFTEQGLTLRVPENWALGGGKPPLVVTAASGDAVIALWRFPSTTPPPTSPAGLRAALQHLVDDARGRDAGLRVIHAVRTRVGGTPAIELDAIERIGDGRRRVRSIHLFEPRAELVLDEYAPTGVFRAVNRSVFTPVRKSLSPVPAAA